MKTETDLEEALRYVATLPRQTWVDVAERRGLSMDDLRQLQEMLAERARTALREAEYLKRLVEAADPHASNEGVTVREALAAAVKAGNKEAATALSRLIGD